MFSNFAARRGHSFVVISCALTFVFASVPAFAAGDAAQGARNYDDTCRHCHGSPQPGKPGAFSDYDSTANRLSVYASDASTITKAANEGYVIPSGNSNDDYLPGTKTYVPMGSFAGSYGKRLGTGTTPTTYAIDIAAYFASLFSAPSEPAISSVSAGDGQASVSFTAPKSDLTIIEYTVTANPGGLHASGSTSPITLSGLSNGTAYKFTLTATSNAGTSKPSSASNTVTPVAAVVAAPTPAPAPAPTPAVVAAKPVVPAAPVVAAPVAKAEVLKEPVKPATPAAKEASPSTASVAHTLAGIPVVSIPLPVTAPIVVVAPVVSVAPVAKSKVEVPEVTAKKVEPAAKESPVASVAPATPVKPAETAVVAAAPVAAVSPAVAAAPVTTPIVPVAKVEALKPTALAAPIAAKTKVSAPVASAAPTPPATNIQAPTMKLARAGSTDARVFFTPAADSSPTTSYIVTALIDGKATGITATGAKSPIKISGLTNGTAYTFTVTAVNGKSSSAASEPSNPVMPLGILGD